MGSVPCLPYLMSPYKSRVCLMPIRSVKMIEAAARFRARQRLRPLARLLEDALAVPGRGPDPLDLTARPFGAPSRHGLRGNCQLACKPGSVWRLPSATAIHLGLGSLPASSNQPGRRPGSRLVAGVASAPVPPLFGLAPGGVCRAASVAGDAVRSYRTLSPLPAEVALRRRFAFCGTFPGVAPGGR